MANEKILTSFVVNGEERLIRDTDILHAEDFQPATTTKLGGVYPDGETVVFRENTAHIIYAPRSISDISEEQIPDDPTRAGEMGCIISYCIINELPAYGYYNAQYLIANPSLGENMYDLYVGYAGPFVRSVSELPQVGFENVYYLIPDSDPEQPNLKKVYTYTNGAFQDTGETWDWNQQSSQEWTTGKNYSAYVGVTQLNKNAPDINIGDKIHLTYNGITYTDTFINIENDIATTSHSQIPTSSIDNAIGAQVNLKTGYLTLYAFGPDFPINEGLVLVAITGLTKVNELEIERNSGAIKRNPDYTYNLANVNRKGGVKVFFNDYTKHLYISSDNNSIAPLKVEYSYYEGFSSDIDKITYFDNVVDINKWIHDTFSTSSSVQYNVKYLSKIKIIGKSATGGTTAYTDYWNNKVGLFSNIRSLREIDLSEFDTSNITDMERMFYNCGNRLGLKKLNLGGKFVTNATENMSYMFYNISRPVSNIQESLIEEIDLSHFNTSNVTSMEYTFFSNESCGIKRILLGNWNTSNVTDLESTFSNVTSEIIGFSSWNTGNVTTMEGTFSGYKYNIDITSWDTSKVTTMESLFSNYGLETTEDFVLDLSNLLVENSLVENMRNMFSSCKVRSIIWPNWGRAENLSSIYRMFSGSSFTTISLTGINTSMIGTMSNLFYGCSNLVSIDATFNTSNTFEMSEMFAQCPNLSSLNVSFVGGTSNVTDMNRMFNGCSSLTSISLASTLDTSNVTNMERMFSECSSLIELNLNNFDVSKVVNLVQSNIETKGFVSMFEGDSSLERIYCNNDWYNLTTRDAKPGKDMFKGCTSITNYDPENPQNLRNAYPDLGGYFTNVV